MRAGNWSQFRDFDAARLSWERARAVADRMPAGPGRDAMRVTPRALLCASSWRVVAAVDDAAFDELRRLAQSADDKVSLALACSGRFSHWASPAAVTMPAGWFLNSRACWKSSAIPGSALRYCAGRLRLLQTGHAAAASGWRGESSTWPAGTRTSVTW